MLNYGAPSRTIPSEDEDHKSGPNGPEVHPPKLFHAPDGEHDVICDGLLRWYSVQVCTEGVSNHWKTQLKKFQSLEEISVTFPTIGNPSCN